MGLTRYYVIKCVQNKGPPGDVTLNTRVYKIPKVKREGFISVWSIPKTVDPIGWSV